MTKLGEVILRDTRANQPVAGVEGRLYYVTDESVLERDSGTTWQDVSATGGTPLTVEEQDGTPSVSPVNTIKVSNGTLTDDGGGVVSLAIGGGSGTVTSVAQTVPAEFSVAGSPVTTSGTLAITKATQTANTVWAGPTSGAAAAPAFRALVGADFADALINGVAGVLFNHNLNSVLGTAGGGNGGLEFNQNANGGYTADPVSPPTADAIGCWGISSNAAGGLASGAIYTSGPGTFNTLAFGGVALDFTVRFRMSALPVAGQDYAIVIGFTNGRSTTPSNGAFLFLDSSVANFRYRTRAAGSQTDVDSGLAAAANTWYTLRIAVNAAGTSVTFTIGGGSSQTLNTNVPNGTGQLMSLVMYSERISGTNNRILYLDYERLAWSEGPA